MASINERVDMMSLEVLFCVQNQVGLDWEPSLVAWFCFCCCIDPSKCNMEFDHDDVKLIASSALRKLQLFCFAADGAD
jgi:hypothetical protein